MTSLDTTLIRQARTAAGHDSHHDPPGKRLQTLPGAAALLQTPLPNARALPKIAGISLAAGQPALTGLLPIDVVK